MLTSRSSLWQKHLVRAFTGAKSDGLNLTHSSQLQVMHTNQWPIPYYKRQNWVPRSLFPETDYNVNIMNTEVAAPDHVNVFLTEQALSRTSWGREVLETMHRLNMKGSLNTHIASPARPAEIYMEDLLQHIGYTRKENARILKKHSFQEIFS